MFSSLIWRYVTPKCFPCLSNLIFIFAFVECLRYIIYYNISYVFIATCIFITACLKFQIISHFYHITFMKQHIPTDCLSLIMHKKVAYYNFWENLIQFRIFLWRMCQLITMLFQKLVIFHIHSNKPLVKIRKITPYVGATHLLNSKFKTSRRIR